MNKPKNFYLRENPDLMIEYPEQRDSLVKKRFLETMRKASKKRNSLTDEEKRQRIKAMCMQKVI